MGSKNYSKVVTFSQLGFIVFSTIAMFFYPGGGTLAGDADRYIFTLNFFSDLGLVNPFNNKTNPFSPQLFAVSLVCFAVGQSYFYIYSTTCTSEKIMHFILLKVAPITSSLSLVLVGFSPNDVVPSYHFTFVSIWLFGLFLSTSTICFYQVKSSRFRMAIFSVTVTTIIVLFSIQSLINIEYLNALRPFTQKVLVYSLAAWFVVGARQETLNVMKV